jgi:hypothetical protein
MNPNLRNSGKIFREKNLGNIAGAATIPAISMVRASTVSKSANVCEIHQPIVQFARKNFFVTK